MDEIKENKLNNEEEDILVSIALQEYANVFEDKKVIENKANFILTASGVILSLILLGIDKFDIWLSMIGCLIMICSSFLCVMSFSLKDYQRSNAELMLNELQFEKGQNPNYKSKIAIITSIEKKTSANRKSYREISNYFRPVPFLFLGGLVIIVISLLGKLIIS